MADISVLVGQAGGGGGGAVTSVFGRVGVVVAVAGDYTVAQVTGAASTALVAATLVTAEAYTDAAVLGLAPLASPTFTGTPAAPTAAPGTDTTQLATTAYVTAAVAAGAFPTSPPASPSPFDDEFTSASLGAIWTSDVVASAPGTVNTFQWDGTWYTMATPGAAALVTTRFHQALSGFNAGTALTIICRVFLSSVNLTSTTCDIGFSVGTSATLGAGSFVTCYVNPAGRALNAARFDGGAATVPLATGDLTVYLAFQRNTANSVRLMFSYDGFSWNQIDGPTTRAWNASFLHVFFDGGSASNPTACGIDFIRVNDARFLLPPL